MTETAVKERVETAEIYRIPPILPEGCPVQPLGLRGDVCWFISPTGELRERTSKEMSAGGLTNLFAGSVGWLWENFPRHNKDGEVTGFNALAAQAALTRACAVQGLFDAGMPVRGPGVWRDADGHLIVHAGDRIFAGDEWKRSGLKLGNAIYPAFPAVSKPATLPAPTSAGEHLLATIRRWNFERAFGADLIFGWIGAAMLGGAPQWRAHMMVTGERGCGKTWMTTLVAAALGGGAHPVQNNYTEAGLRQQLTAEARAIILDEGESESGADGGKIQKVIELLRHMSGGDGARVLRGSADHSAKSFSLTGCAYLSSILHVPLKPQDRSRISRVRLAPLGRGGNEDSSDQVLAAIKQVEKSCPAMRARAIAGWARFNDTMKIYRAAIIAAGCDSREADQLATILSGRDLLLHDTLPHSDNVAEIIAQVRFLIEEAKDQGDEDGEGHQCIRHLLSSTAELWRSGDKKTIGQLLANAAKHDPMHDDTRQAIGAIGLRVIDYQRGTPVLLIANTHVGLDKIFAGTRWHGGAWGQALRYLPGATPYPKAVRIGGLPVRCTAVLMDWLQKAGEHDDL